MVTSVKKNLKECVKVHSFNNIETLNLEHFGSVAIEPDQVRIIKSVNMSNDKFLLTQTERMDQGPHVMEKIGKDVNWVEQLTYVEYALIGAALLVMVIEVCGIYGCISKVWRVKEVNYLEGLLLPEDDSEPKKVFNAEVKKNDDNLDSVTKRMLQEYAGN